MPITLSHVIVHQLKKNSQDELCVQFRNELLSPCASAQDFINELHTVYTAKSAKGFGQFAPESEFASWLYATRKGESDFLSFSSKAAQRLKDELAKYPFANEGILVLAEYRALATDYLLIGLLESRQSMNVTEDLELSSTAYVDIAKMDIVAQIDLSTWESDPSSNRYLTYVKGRVGRKVADFFLDFMQADVGLDTKQQNQVLVQAVEDYYAQTSVEAEDKKQYQQQVYDYCQTQSKACEDVKITELAQVLPATDQGDFSQFVEKQGYELEECFPVDKSTVRKLTKFVGNGGGVSINFDNLLLGERVFYDEDSDTLTIKGTPPNLRDQLKRYMKTGH